MTQRSLWWFAIAASLGIAVLLGRSCSDDDTDGRAAPNRDRSAVAASSASPADAQAAAASRLEAKRTQAISGAVDAVHGYLQALGMGELDRANGFWASGRPDAASSEADLRTLKDFRSLRIQNRAPTALDSQTVPAAFEVPVELRVGTDDGVRLYRGRYRLRSSDPAGGAWKITSASIRRNPPDPSP